MELKEKEIKEEIEKNRYKLLGQISVLEKNYEDLIQYIKKKIKYKLGRYFLKRLDLQGNIYKTRVVNGELNYYNDRRNDLIDFDDYWY